MKAGKFSMFMPFVACAVFMFFNGTVNATTVGAINVPAYAYVGTEYVENPNSTIAIREVYVPNLSNGVCANLAASYVTAGFVSIKFPNGQTFVSKKVGTCVQMFTPVTDVTAQ